ncbi:MAG: DUF4126 domain-containing protein [Deltaproteobacteria bacterium]|nr:DUF4126 domain-containing protein [Deltaproteobacteria bacterium]
MEQLDQIVQIIALSMGVAWASGINLYAAILVLGLLGASGNMALPPDLQILTNPIVLGAAGIMYIVEFFADKVPAVDTSWDALHTFIRIPAGALLAAGAVGDVNPALALAAGIAGGGIAAGTHATKSGTRVLVNTSPEPFSNWAVSIGEDIVVVVGLWTALQHPILFILLLICFILLLIWLLPKLWRGIKKVFRGILRLFGRKEPAPDPESNAGAKPEGTRLIQDLAKTEKNQ